MSEQELSFSAFARRFGAGAITELEPAADLWSRIVIARRQRVVRRRLQRGAALATAVIAVALAVGYSLPAKRETTDWQARAAQLEMEWRGIRAGSERLLGSAESELNQIDRSLQAAYDRGDQNECVALWKQRSTILGALVTARRIAPAVTRI